MRKGEVRRPPDFRLFLMAVFPAGVRIDTGKDGIRDELADTTKEEEQWVDERGIKKPTVLQELISALFPFGCYWVAKEVPDDHEDCGADSKRRHNKSLERL